MHDFGAKLILKPQGSIEPLLRIYIYILYLIGGNHFKNKIRNEQCILFNF